MTNAVDFTREELERGRLTPAHVAELVRRFQFTQGLTVDGIMGPATRAALDALMGAPLAHVSTPLRFLANPLPKLADGRVARVTSGFQSADRPDHNGIDWFYEWRAGDLPKTTGDGLAATRLPSGNPKWGVPFGTLAQAAAPGRVVLAGNSPTGYRVWIDHGNGLRSGYFHLTGIAVSVGDVVKLGDPLGPVGDNPKDIDARHLHFEVSPVDRYTPLNPTLYLIA